MDKYCFVKTSVANLYKNPSFKSELVTQAIYLEKLLILDQENNWYQIYFPGSGVTQYDNLNKNIFSQQSIDYVQFCLRWSYQGSKGPWISSYVFTLQ